MAAQQTTDSKQSETSKRKPARKQAPPTVEAAGPLLSGAPLEAALDDPSSASPSAILQLQRKAGNRAVNRLLAERAVQAKLSVGPAGDKYEQEADRVASQVMRAAAPTPPNPAKREEDLDGGLQRMPLSASITSLQRAPAETQTPSDPRAGFEAGRDVEQRLANPAGGRPLPADTQTFMESRFGSSFGKVRIHTGSDSVQLSRDLNAQAFTHGSHIFFDQGKFNPGTHSGKQLLAHELTHVVQQGQAGPSNYGPVQRSAGQPVVQRSLSSWFKAKFGKKKGKEEEGAKKEEAPKEKPEAVKPPPSEQLQDAIKFEKRLGRYAFSHAKANTAAQNMTDKMTKAMIGDLDKENEAQQKELTALYGKEDRQSSAGQVGTEFASIWDVLHTGNLRERLTALMNAMFGPFKQYLSSAMRDSKWSEMQAKGLNVDKLKRRKRQMRFNPGAKDLYRDPGNPLDRKKFGSWMNTGKTRDEAKGSSERTVGELQDKGIGLSDREKAYQFKGQDGDLSGEKLKWQEGGTYWKMRENNKWVQKVQNSLKMPVVAGPSGSMLRMFQLWEFLNKPIPAADWRLAVLGWMLSSNDHSFHEMMMTAADYGLPYSPGQRAYMDVKPLTVWELRQNVAKDGLFPHEAAFKRKTESGGFKMMDKDSIDDAEDAAEEANDAEANKDTGAAALSAPGAAAIQLYTSFGYLILNPSRSGGMLAKKQIERAIQNKSELKSVKKLVEEGKVTVDELIAEAQEIIPVLESALETMPDWKGKLFRGTGSFNPFLYREGSEISFGAFTSSTLDEDVAKDFADNFNIGPFKYILELDVTAGKDIRQVSVANEDEVLIPPGSKFKVTKRTKPTDKDKYYRITLAQTAKGGGSLNLGEQAKEPEPEEDDSEQPVMEKPRLAVYEHKGDTDVAFMLPWEERDYMNNEVESGDWTVFTFLKDGSDYWCKNDELADFFNPPAKAPSKPPVAANPLKGMLNASPEKLVEFHSMGGSSEDLTAPIGIEILDDQYMTLDEFSYVMVKLDDGRMGNVYKDQLMAVYVSSVAASGPSVVNKDEDEVAGEYDHVPNGKYDLTLPAGKKVVVYSHETSSDAREMVMDADQRVKLVVLDDLKAHGRCRMTLWGKGIGDVYIAINDVFGKDGKPSAAIEHGGGSVDPKIEDDEDEDVVLVPESEPVSGKTPLAYVDDPDISEEPIGTIDSPTDIVDADVSKYEKDGTVWVNIVMKAGGFVYVKQSDLTAFMSS